MSIIKVDRGEMLRLFDEIRSSFPHLRMALEPEHPHVDVMLEIERQTGMVFEVALYLDGDELHISAGHFWLEWFPCDRPEVVEAYREAVLGLLSGRYRIVEDYFVGRAIGARLQVPSGAGWRTIGTSGFPLPRVPWVTRRTLLQNAAREGGAQQSA